MHKWNKFIFTFLKHWYTVFILLASDPFDILERWAHMTYSPPTWLFYVLLSLAIGLALLLTALELRKLTQNNPIAWIVYDNLSELFRKLVHSTIDRDRDIIRLDIERERGKLPDRGLDKLIRLFLDAESEQATLGLDSYSEDTQYILSAQNERMRHYILNKYGERIWKQSTANTANPNG